MLETDSNEENSKDEMLKTFWRQLELSYLSFE